MPNPTTTLALVAALPIGALLVAGIVAWARRGNAIVDEQPPAPVVVHGQSNLADIFGGWDCVCGEGSWTKHGCTSATPDDLTALADVLAIDPPTTRLYVVPDPALVRVGNAMVHPGCRDVRRDRGVDAVRNCCAPLLARSATEVPW